MLDAAEIIDRLHLLPHPEGGYYAETWRAAAEPGTRPAGSAIYYLLRAGDHSTWHRIDVSETWHFYAGDPLELAIAPGHGAEPAKRFVLGADLVAGQLPQLVVSTGDWQSAVSLGDWTLAGCTVSPAFLFEGLELAPPGWQPGDASRSA